MWLGRLKGEWEVSEPREWWFNLTWHGEYSTPVNKGPYSVNEDDEHILVIEKSAYDKLAEENARLKAELKIQDDANDILTKRLDEIKNDIDFTGVAKQLREWGDSSGLRQLHGEKENEIERLKAELEQVKIESKYGPPRNKVHEWYGHWQAANNELNECRNKVRSLERTAESYRDILRDLVDCWTDTTPFSGYRESNLKKDPENERGLYESKFLSVLLKARQALENSNDEVICPNCGKAHIQYPGVMNLECSTCIKEIMFGAALEEGE